MKSLQQQLFTKYGDKNSKFINRELLKAVNQGFDLQKTESKVVRVLSQQTPKINQSFQAPKVNQSFQAPQTSRVFSPKPFSPQPSRGSLSDKYSMWDLMTLYDTQKKLAQEQAQIQQKKLEQKQLRNFYDHQINEKQQQKFKQKMSDRINRRSIDQMVQIQQKEYEIQQNDRKQMTMQNVQTNKALNFIIKKQKIQMVTPRIMQSSPLLQFGPSVQKDDVERAKAVRLARNELTRNEMLEELEHRQSQKKQNRLHELNLEKQTIETQFRTIDARKINQDLKTKSIFDKMNKFNNYFESEGVQHYTKYDETYGKKIQKLTKVMEQKERNRVQTQIQEKMEKRKQLFNQTVDFNREMIDEQVDYVQKIQKKKCSPNVKQDLPKQMQFYQNQKMQKQAKQLKYKLELEKQMIEQKPSKIEQLNQQKAYR